LFEGDCFIYDEVCNRINDHRGGLGNIGINNQFFNQKEKKKVLNTVGQGKCHDKKKDLFQRMAVTFKGPVTVPDKTVNQPQYIADQIGQTVIKTQKIHENIDYGQCYKSIHNTNETEFYELNVRSIFLYHIRECLI
jgi:hypothetical protein